MAPSLRRIGRIRHLPHYAVVVTRALRAQRQTRRASEEAQAMLSRRLRAFIAQLPEERTSLLTFADGRSSTNAAGHESPDAGSGDAPYRELFAHCDYVTADWENSPHASAPAANIVGSLKEMPVADGSFDAVLCTQVLEHVADPIEVLRELHRIIRPGGRLYLTVPLVGELHEEPYDFFRYTPYGLGHLLTTAGFAVDSLSARNSYFTTLGSLARIGTWAIGDEHDGREAQRATVRRILGWLTPLLTAFDDLDQRRALPSVTTAWRLAQRGSDGRADAHPLADR